MSDLYILDGKIPVRVDDVIVWGKWFEKNKNRRVARTEIGDVVVSTVFFGIDHSFAGEEPMLFETMVFGGTLNEDMERYPTWKEAEKGHKFMVKRVKSENSNK